MLREAATGRSKGWDGEGDSPIFLPLGRVPLLSRGARWDGGFIEPKLIPLAACYSERMSLPCT